MCCLFIKSSSPLRPTSPSLNVFESRVPASRRPGVPASPCPTSPSPTSRRLGVPESHVPASPNPTSRSPRVLASQVPRPRPTFSHSRGKVGRLNDMTEKFSNFHFHPGNLIFDRSLSIKPRKQLEINTADTGHSITYVEGPRQLQPRSQGFSL